MPRTQSSPCQTIPERQERLRAIRGTDYNSPVSLTRNTTKESSIPSRSKDTTRVAIINRHSSDRAKKVSPGSDRRPRRVLEAKHSNVCRNAALKRNRAGRKQQILIVLSQNSIYAALVDSSHNPQETRCWTKPNYSPLRTRQTRLPQGFLLQEPTIASSSYQAGKSPRKPRRLL